MTAGNRFIRHGLLARGSSRRSFLRQAAGAAGALTLAAAGGIAVRGWQTGAFGALTDGAEFDLWRDWESGALAGPRALVGAAVLAASPRNTQPWLFRLDSAGIELRLDPTRWLGHPDPFRREMLIGLGCALENLATAARGLGWAAGITLMPDPEDAELVARVELAPAAPAPDQRFRALARRHTHRGPYRRDLLIPRRTQDALQSLARSGRVRLLLIDTMSPAGVAFAAATLAATETFVADSRMTVDSDHWFRHSLAEMAAHRDGVTTLTAGLREWRLRGALMLPGPWLGDIGQSWIAATRDVQLPTAALHGLIVARRPDDPLALLRVGRLWQRMHLEGTALGLAMQPLNQAMEIADRDRLLDQPSAAAEALAGILESEGFDAGWTAVFGFRAGVAAIPAHPSPRRPLEDVLLA